MRNQAWRARAAGRALAGLALAFSALSIACGGEEGGEPPLFGAQTFSDGFESGKPGSRWGCNLGGCSWEVVEVPGPISPTTSTGAGAPLAAMGSNYVFQSPDPQAIDLNRQGHCERFSAHFEEAGTFAFDYFVNTAGPVGFQDANVLEVSIGTSTVEDDPDFGPIPIDTEWETVLSLHGRANSRFQSVLPPGYYDFEFCYFRWRTFDLGPDFVQVDNVETCVGTDCLREIPPDAACTADQGQTLVPDLEAVPRHLFTLTGSGDDGVSSPFILILDADVLDLFVQDLDPTDPVVSNLREQIDGVRNETLVDAQTCDTDTRRYVLLEMTEAEALEFVLSTFEVNEAFLYVYLAVKSGWTTEKTQEMVQAFISQVTPWKAKVVQHIVENVD